MYKGLHEVRHRERTSCKQLIHFYLQDKKAWLNNDHVNVTRDREVFLQNHWGMLQVQSKKG